MRTGNTTANTKAIIAWKFKGLSDESIKPPSTPNDSLVPKME